MSAIITENFRRNNTSSFLADLNSNGNQYYVGLGKSDPWTADEGADPKVPNPLGTYLDEREIKSNLITLIGILSANGTKVIPNNIFSSNTVYKSYDPLNDNCFYASTDGTTNITHRPCYVSVSGSIFLCLYSPGVKTSIPPVYTLTKYKPFSTADGYVWILLDTIAVNSINTVITDQFVSIISDISASYETGSIKDAQGGLLYGFTIIDGGQGYTGTDINFTYNYKTSAGTTGSLNLIGVITSGAIASINFDIVTTHLIGITGGTITLTNPTSGSGFKAIAKIAPDLGFAYQPYKILPAWYVALSVKAASLISGDGFYIPYRQISVIKNPTVNVSVDPLTIATSLRCLPYLILSNTASVMTGDILTMNGSTKIIVDTLIHDGSTYKLYYHQNNTSDYGDTGYHSNMPIITKDGITIGATVTDSILGEYTANSGDVIFIENRVAINRTASQTEEIKIIIQF